ncbi:MAG: fused MFS/spermidine synthase [Candidatus Doudnabacteria bacterium]|nr:fused MFS/spermidine synthase [Candidatus Doudnabacteria bacterium]
MFENRVSKFFLTAVLATAFLSSFLLFQVQPLLGKLILPWFGGIPAVWITAMLFFQIMLVAGYAYAHFATKYLPAPWQALIHFLLLGAAVFFLPIVPDAFWKLAGGTEPSWHILKLLFYTVALPYLALSSSIPILSVWLSRQGFSSPLRLYALSNLAAFLALLSFPLVFEPIFSGNNQAAVWSGIFVVYTVFFLVAGVFHLAKKNQKQETSRELSGGVIEEHIGIAEVVKWLFLSAAGSLLLLAVTNSLTQDIASFPLLWIIPLSLYLLSFVLTFDDPRWYHRKVYGLFFALAVVFWLFMSYAGANVALLFQIAIYAVLLFSGCMLCHGELAQAKPGTEKISFFYLMLAVGGAVGGLIAALIAPRYFPSILELHVSVVLVAIVAFAVNFANLPESVAGAMTLSKEKMVFTVAFSLLLVAIILNGLSPKPGTIYQKRNFFGVIRVVGGGKEQGQFRHYTLLNGRINHGMQFAGESERRLPTTYYGENSGVGTLLKNLDGEKLRIGVVGLGAGTLAAYAGAGDFIKFYELNPEVGSVAENYFSFLRDSLANKEIAIGDARVSMEREEQQDFDLLAIDAFSGDAIPVHLLTQEAMEVYLKHVDQNGVIAFHITNIHLDLRPVVFALAEQFGLKAFLVGADSVIDKNIFRNDWILMGRRGLIDREFLDPWKQGTTAESFPKKILWTDQNSNLLRILKF